MAIPVKTDFATGSGHDRSILNKFYEFGKPTGNIFYVHSDGSSTGPGYSPSTAFSTLDAAVGACTANNGDVIIVLEGHAETIAAAGGVTCDVAGITIIGVGNGRGRPTFTFATDTAATFLISAANVRVEGLVFICNIDDQVTMLSVTASNSIIRNCELLFAATPDAEAVITYGASADRFILENCLIHSTGSTTAATGVTFGACDDCVIRGNMLSGYFATNGGIVNSAAAVNVMIIDNYIVNYTADGNNKTIVLHASTTGLLAKNCGGIIDSTSPAPVTATGAWVAGNYWSSAAGVTASVLM